MINKTGLTMSKIAKELGLSRMAVSAVVNGKCKERGFSKKTEEKVNAYLRKKGFVPSKYASKLRKGETGGVGVLFNSEFYPMMMSSLERVLKELRKNDSVEMIAVNNNDLRNGFEELISRRVSKLIWFQSFVELEDALTISKLMPYMNNFSQKIIYNYNFGYNKELDAKLLKAGVNLVGLNLDSGYRDLCKYLKKAGHKKIVALLSPSKFEVFTGNGIEVRALPQAAPGLDDYSKMQYYADALLELKKNYDFSAVYYHDYLKSLYLIDILHEKGIDVPEDLSLWGYGYDSHPFYRISKMSMLNIPVNDMVECVVKLLKDDSAKASEHCFSHEVLDRGTSRSVSTG